MQNCAAQDADTRARRVGRHQGCARSRTRRIGSEHATVCAVGLCTALHSRDGASGERDRTGVAFCHGLFAPDCMHKTVAPSLHSCLTCVLIRGSAHPITGQARVMHVCACAYTRFSALWIIGLCPGMHTLFCTTVPKYIQRRG
jgi:hypothetical protein